MTQDPNSVANEAFATQERQRPTQQDLLRRAAALLKDLFADAELPADERDERRKPQDGVFQPRRY